MARSTSPSPIAGRPCGPVFSRVRRSCAVPACSADAGSSEILCASHEKKVGKQRMARVYLWRDRLRNDPKQADPAYATWKAHYEYAVRSAVTQAGGEPVLGHRPTEGRQADGGRS
jgi:hypothetical protein